MKRNQKGVAHLAALLTFVVVFAIVGAYVLVKSHAQQPVANNSTTTTTTSTSSTVPDVTNLTTVKVTGNGTPSGPHYNLNLIGFANGQQTLANNNSGGNVIHVPLYGNCKIDLTQGDFQVLDSNCTNGPASFQLPSPGTGTQSAYSVYVAARGKPLGSATANTCYTDTTTNTNYCSMYVMDLSRNFGANKFTNVTKDLLYVYQCVNGSVTQEPLFATVTNTYYWNYDNNGLRNAALRFYPGVQTDVPSAGTAC